MLRTILGDGYQGRIVGASFSGRSEKLFGQPKRNRLKPHKVYCFHRRQIARLRRLPSMTSCEKKVCRSGKKIEWWLLVCRHRIFRRIPQMIDRCKPSQNPSLFCFILWWNSRSDYSIIGCGSDPVAYSPSEEQIKQTILGHHWSSGNGLFVNTTWTPMLDIVYIIDPS
jgi:hypothetical protein